jgi:hypothetical protein
MLYQPSLWAGDERILGDGEFAASNLTRPTNGYTRYIGNQMFDLQNHCAIQPRIARYRGGPVAEQSIVWLEN